MNNIELQALKLLNSGISIEDVEKRLKHEFIVFKDSLTDKITSITLWK